MQQVALEFAGGFLFAELLEGRFLLDTGSPASFGSTGQVTFGARTAPIAERLPGFGLEHIRVLVPGRCDGLLGMDRLASERMLLDVPGGTLKVGDEAWQGIAESKRRAVDVRLVGPGWPSVQVTVGGRHVQALFDTGSRYCYSLDPQLVVGGEPQPELEDFNPMLGHLRSPSWLVDLQLRGGGAVGVQYRDRMAVLPQQHAEHLATLARAVGVSGLVGNAWLRDRQLGMDVRSHGAPALWAR